jgi:hypothetical protein
MLQLVRPSTDACLDLGFIESGTNLPQLISKCLRVPDVGRDTHIGQPARDEALLTHELDASGAIKRPLVARSGLPTGFADSRFF